MRSTYGARTVSFAGPPSWRFLPLVTKATLALLGLGYVLSLAAPRWLEPFSLDVGAARRLELWRFVTYPVVETSILGLLLSGLFFWQFGSELERSWGSRRYAGFLVSATVSAGALGVCAALVLRLAGGTAGPASVSIALIAAWALLGPDRPVLFLFFPLKAKWVAILAIVLSGLGALEASRSIAQVLFVLGGLPVAWLYARRGALAGALGSLRYRLGRRKRFRVIGRDDRHRFH